MSKKEEAEPHFQFHLFLPNDSEEKLPFTIGDRYITHLEISVDFETQCTEMEQNVIFRSSTRSRAQSEGTSLYDVLPYLLPSC